MGIAGAWVTRTEPSAATNCSWRLVRARVRVRRDVRICMLEVEGVVDITALGRSGL